jgi:predicted NAD-dependent protein-ADP-ribosyltransferase YbiA (DUF1768 family)
MAIVFSSREGDPYRDLTNDPWSRFDEDGFTWPAVTVYVLAMRHDDPAVGERFRKLWKSPAVIEAERAIASQRIEAWAEREPAIVRHAVERKFEAYLPHRALLLSTGDESLVCEDDPALGPLLMELRRRARARADDPRAVQCEHLDARDLERACVHLIDGHPTPRYHRRFSGRGVAYARVCPGCAAIPDFTAVPWRWVCARCVTGLGSARESDVGSPECASRDDGLRFTLEQRTLPLTVDLRAIAPLDDGLRWVAFDRERRVVVLDAVASSVTPVVTLPADAVGEGAALDLHVAPGGELVAIVEHHGLRGCVVDLAAGAVTMTLLRGDYCAEVSRFPIAFVRHHGRLLLAHATDWNRLDLSDPRTGALLTERTLPEYVQGAPRDPRHLDYFYGGLHVSPDGTRCVSDGWVWHPIGVPRVFALTRWAEENVWETEDGPSVRSLAAYGEEWDLPLCWIDDRTLARWGVDVAHESECLPGVDLFDVETGERVRSVIGPARGLAFDERLYAFEAGHGLTAWDVTTGERTLCIPDFVPDGYHRAARCFWRLTADGVLTLGRVSEAGS